MAKSPKSPMDARDNLHSRTVKSGAAKDEIGPVPRPYQGEDGYYTEEVKLPKQRRPSKDD